MKQKRTHKIGVLVSLVTTAPLWGQTPVPVTNAGFEDPVTGDASTSAISAPWTAVAGNPTIFNPSTSQFASEAPEGDNTLSIFGGADGDGVSQILSGTTGQLQVDASYALTVQVGDPLDSAFDGYKIQLLANGTVLGEDDNTVVPADGAFATATMNYVYDVADAALVGEPLEIRILSKGLNNGDLEADDVQLTVTLTNPIAEPGGPYTVPTGGSLSLDGSGSLPSDGQSITLYEWDLNNDGTYDVTGVTPTAVSESDLINTYGMTVGADHDIVLRVTDDSTVPKTATALGTVTLPAPIAGQLGVLDLDANGGINPNTGIAWAVGDQYRIAFVTNGTTTTESNDPQFYRDFVTAQAWAVPALQKSYWTPMMVINLDSSLIEAESPKLEARDFSGTSDVSGSATAPGGGGAPVYVVDGATCIARNNADIWNGWSNPFNGNTTVRVGSVHYSPYLDQFGNQPVGTPDTNHGADVATGCNNAGSTVRAHGNSADANGTDASKGSSNANNSGRVWNRFGTTTTTSNRLYAISYPLTVVDLTETVAPTFVSIGDDRGGADALLNVDSIVYTVTFSEAMDITTVDITDFGNTSGSTASVTLDSVRPTFDPAVFEVTVTPTSLGTVQLELIAGSDLKDLVGNSLDTAAASIDDTVITVISDADPPLVDTLSPANGATDVGLSPTLVITFDEVSDVVLGATGTISLLDAADDTVLQSYEVTDPEVSVSGTNEVSIALSSISFGKSVYVNITADAIADISGNSFAGIADKTTWAFSVVGLPAPAGPLSVFTATAAGELVTDAADLVHDFDTFPRLSANHIPATPSDIQLSAGHHLVIYNSRFDSFTGSSNRTEVQTNLNLNGVDLASGWSQGYIRRQETQDETITAGGAIIDVATAGDILQLQSIRTDNIPAEQAIREPGNTGIQLLKLDDSWDYLSLAGHDGSGADQVLPADNTTWSPVTYAQELEKDTGSFEYVSGTGVTLKTTGHYLVLANSYNSGANERTGVVQRLTLGVTEIDGSATTVYLRGPGGNSAQEGATSIGMIIETTAPNQVLNVELRQSDNDGTLNVIGTKTGLTIAKLPDTAEYIRLSDLTGGQNINAVGAVNYDDDPASQLEVDGSFAHSPTTDPSRIGVTATGDYLFMASFFVASDGTSRGFPVHGWQVNGTGGIAAYGQTGRYSRNAGPPELGNWSGFMVALSASDYVETLTAPLGNPGGSNPATVLAMQGVSIDSLFTAPPANVYATWSGTFAGLTDTDAALDFDKGGLQTGIEWVVGGDPTDPTDDAGLAPTIDTNTSPGNALFVFRRTDEAAGDANTTIKVEYGSTLQVWTEAVDGTAGVDINIDDEFYGTGIDKVTVTLPAALAVDGALYARLNVVVTAP